MKADREINLQQLIRIVLPTLLSMAGMRAILKLAHVAGILPQPSVSMYPDSAVLLHQSLASRASDPASIILLGDSTCLMGVDARELSSELPGHPRVKSLALLVWLDLRVYAEVLSDFVKANPHQVQAVVLLVSPAKLAGAATDSGLWNQIHHTRQAGETEPTRTFKSWSGLKLLRENIWGHLLDTPLKAKEVAFMGFSSELVAYQVQHQGSLVEYGTFPTSRRERTNQWLLAPEFEAETREFKSRMPSSCKLFIGITPSPKSSGESADRIFRDEVLQQWNQWMHADAVLTNLPAVLPDFYFSATAHLNELGQKKYTTCVAQALAVAMKDSSAENAERQ